MTSLTQRGGPGHPARGRAHCAPLAPGRRTSARSRSADADRNEEAGGRICIGEFPINAIMHPVHELKGFGNSAPLSDFGPNGMVAFRFSREVANPQGEELLFISHATSRAMCSICALPLLLCLPGFPIGGVWRAWG